MSYWLFRVVENATETVDIPNPLNFTGKLKQGVFASALKGSGIALARSGDGTAVNRVYADDAGAVLWGTGSVPDIRGSLSRVLLTKDNTGGNIRVHGLMGQLKAYDAFWNNEVVSAVHGRLELVRSAATMTLGGYGISAGVLGVVAASGAITVNTNHILAGVASISDFRATLTQTGKTAAFLAAAYDTTNWSDSTSRTKWGYGLFVHQDGATRGVHVGTLGTNTTAGLPIGGATALNGFYADDSGAAQTASTVWRNLEARTYLSVSQGNAAADQYVIRGQMKTASGITLGGDTSVKAAVNGYAELVGALTIDTGSFFAPVLGEIWSDGNITVNGTAGGVMSRLYTSAGTMGATLAAFVACKQWASTNAWPIGLYIPSEATNLAIKIGTSSSSAQVGHHLSSTNARAIACYTDDDNAALAGDVQAIQSRLAIFAAQNGSAAAEAVRGHLRIVGANITPAASKAWYATSGYVEMSGTETIGDGSNWTVVAGLGATVEGGTTTVAANGILAGVHISGKTLPASPTGECVGILFQAITQGYEHTFGFSGVGTTDGNGLTAAAADGSSWTHKIAVWINGVGTRYIHLASD